MNGVKKKKWGSRLEEIFKAPDEISVIQYISCFDEKK
jgi:hypothetical protein